MYFAYPTSHIIYIIDLSLEYALVIHVMLFTCVEH